jgi:hypothetical protein
MRARARIGGLASLAALAIASLLVAQPGGHRPSSIGHDSPSRAPSVASASPLATTPPPTSSQFQPRTRAEPVRRASPGAIADRFLAGWLACTYHQRSCHRLPGALPRYAASFDRDRGNGITTPAERAARPRVRWVNEIRGCSDSATVTASYQDGEGGLFQVHLNLINTPAGWRVFDVAEAPPHIPLPPPLPRGPRAC